MMATTLPATDLGPCILTIYSSHYALCSP